MKKLSVRWKLGILAGFLLALVVGEGLYGAIESKRAQTVLTDITDVQMPAVRNMTLVDMMHDGLRAVVYSALYTAENGTADDKKAVREELAEMSGNIKKYMSDIEALNIDDELRKTINEAKPEVEAYTKSAAEITGLALDSQRSSAIAQLPEFNKAFTNLEEKLEKVGELIESQAQKASADAIKEAETSRTVSEVILGLGFFVGLAVSWFIVRDLVSTLGTVIEKLTQSAKSTSEASGNSSQSAHSLREASQVQASSLQETMASAEQISAMVTQNAESAVKAKSAVEQNAQAADAGSKSVDEMIGAISEIKSTNNDILLQMEASNKELGNIVKIIGDIGEKTKVINDIVFQTKLLSFNASVEAARAGEHGKGFAVVAEEVGNLAQMSGNAAKEITDMLGNSVKQVNEIVEQTSRKVDHLVEVGKDKVSMGQAIAERCKQALTEVSENARTVAQLVSEISNASKEQAQGVQEINAAIAQLDKTTQQNAVVATQSANQAEHLNAEASELSKIVTGLFYYLNGANARYHEEAHREAPALTKAPTVESSLKERTQPARTMAKVLPIKNKHVSKQEIELKSAVTKKAVGANEVPSSDDPSFEEF